MEVQQFQMTNPFADAVNAASGQYNATQQNQKDAQDKADALKQQAFTNQLATNQDTRAQATDTRAASAQADAIRHEGVEEQRDKDKDAIDKEKNDYEKSRRKIQEKIDSQTLLLNSQTIEKGRKDAILQDIKTQTDRLALSDAQFQSRLTHKYGDQQAAAALAEVQQRTATSHAEQLHTEGQEGREAAGLGANGLGQKTDRSMPGGMSKPDQLQWGKYNGELKRALQAVPKKVTKDDDGNFTTTYDWGSAAGTRYNNIGAAMDKLEGIDPKTGLTPPVTPPVVPPRVPGKVNASPTAAPVTPAPVSETQVAPPGSSKKPPGQYKQPDGEMYTVHQDGSVTK